MLLANALSLANKVSKTATGVKTIASLSGYLDEMMGFVTGAASKVSPDLLLKGNLLVAAGTAAAMGYSIFQGQEIGGVSHFVKGFADIGAEEYYESGSDQSGTATEAFGNVAQGLAISAYAALSNSGALEALLGPKAKYLGLINKALFAWQASTLVDEVARGDGDTFKDPLDIGGNLLSLISLAALAKKGGSVNIPRKPGGGLGGVCASNSPIPKNPRNLLSNANASHTVARSSAGNGTHQAGRRAADSFSPRRSKAAIDAATESTWNVLRAAETTKTVAQSTLRIMAS